MGNVDVKPPYMVEGEVVQGSPWMWVMLAVLGALVALSGVGLLFSGWSQIAVWGFVLVESPFVASVILMTVGILLASLGGYKVKEGTRLILGSDRLQLVTARGRVLTQIPYRNISAAKLVDVQMEMGIVVKRIHIDVHDANDPETVIEHASIFREAHGCDCMIDPPEFVLGADQLHERIQSHLQKFLAR